MFRADRMRYPKGAGKPKVMERYGNLSGDSGVRADALRGDCTVVSSSTARLVSAPPRAPARNASPKRGDVCTSAAWAL